MATFALVTEGQTDQIILEKIISELCEDFFEEGVEVNHLQPLRDKSDAKHAPHAGWELVFEYAELSTERALATNEYVVFQIDTDCGDHENFNLALTAEGKERHYLELVNGARDIIIDRIGDKLYRENADRFIFAVSVHSMESWILLYNYNIDRTKNCFSHLCREIKRRESKNHKKEVEHYKAIAKNIRLNNLRNLMNHDSSLGYFLRSLDQINPQVETD